MAEAKSKIEQLRRLTVKTVFGAVDIEEVLKKADKRMDCMSIYGIVRRFKPDSSEIGGEFVRFYGQLRAVNLKTGEVFEGGQCILPGIAQDALYGALSGADTAEVQFACKIGVKYDPKAVTKYVYTVESLLPPQESSPLAQLEKGLRGDKLLPAPK